MISQQIKKEYEVAQYKDDEGFWTVREITTKDILKTYSQSEANYYAQKFKKMSCNDD